MSMLKGIAKQSWFLPLIAILLVGSVIASVIVVSNTVNHTSHVQPPTMTLGAISPLNGSTYPGGDLPDLVSNDPVVNNMYDFSCLIDINADLEGVYLNITVSKIGGQTLSSDDVTLYVCDYSASNNSVDWSWRSVPLVVSGSRLIGVCEPSWGNSLQNNDECNLLNAFRIVYHDIADFTISVTATTSPPTVPVSLLQEIQQRGSIIVGTQVPYPPFENINATTDELEGLDIEIMEYVAAKLGVTITWKTMDFDPLFAAVQTGQLDCAISSIMISAARDEVNDFSSPYYVANQAVLVRDDSTISTMNDLNSSDLVTQLGLTGQWWVDENLSPLSNVLLTDVPAAVIGVENGLWDAFITDNVVAYQYANDTNYNLKVAFVIYTMESYGILIPQDEPELKAAINAAVAEMIADGTLDNILIRWLV
ncbi:MAG: amino acid ABC transporter substrate-binding protein [Methanomassiliicoccales archaeon]|nr:amino acid ABC transporter substrate-binding protein [Methanomassiliicoccales archaeon]